MYPRRLIGDDESVVLPHLGLAGTQVRRLRCVQQSHRVGDTASVYLIGDSAASTAAVRRRATPPPLLASTHSYPLLTPGAKASDDAIGRLQRDSDVRVKDKILQRRVAATRKEVLHALSGPIPDGCFGQCVLWSVMQDVACFEPAVREAAGAVLLEDLHEVRRRHEAIEALRRREAATRESRGTQRQRTEAPVQPEPPRARAPRDCVRRVTPPVRSSKEASRRRCVADFSVSLRVPGGNLATLAFRDGALCTLIMPDRERQHRAAKVVASPSPKVVTTKVAAEKTARKPVEVRPARGATKAAARAHACNEKRAQLLF